MNQLLSYKPFGSTNIDNQYDTVNQTKRFTGHDYDAETELSYMGARYYDGQVGRFTAQDPANLDNRITKFLYDPQQLNTYSYARNNPLMFTDPDGEEIDVGSHLVAFGSYHTSIRIIPENQELYKDNPNFSNTLEDGRVYATLGAGPEGGDLTGGINRASDVDQTNKVNFTSVDIGTLNEDSVISSLFDSSSNYQNQLDYDLFPRNDGQRRWWVADDGYNSNSYTSGLLNSAGLYVPGVDYKTP